MGEAVKVVDGGSSPTKKTKIEDYILTRRTPELVMAFCGAAGSGVSAVIRRFKEIMERSPYGYNVEIVKISEGIETLKDGLRKAVDTTWANDFGAIGKRAADLQEYGNALREEYATDVLSQYAISEIIARRAGGYFDEPEKAQLEKGIIPKTQKRILWIIDSLKNPNEVEALRYVYGEMFFQIGVLCPHDKRMQRLKSKGMSDKEAALIIEKDKSEEVQYGQKLIDTIHKSDFFVNNSEDSMPNIEKELTRFINILFGYIETPTKHEYAMYVAQSSAYSSGCLSRQVGASIVDEEGSVVSYGCNDVPKAGGGLYCAEDNPDNRCFKTFDRACQSSKRKDVIIKKIEKKISLFIDELKKTDKNGDVTEYLTKNFDVERFVGDLSKYSGINIITEYTKAVHAEMDAILKLARKGGVSSRNCSMYVTTYPCHNCAKHIIASGIKMVYYIEPYEKSLAYELHADAISLEDTKDQTKVKFIPFHGVSPRRYQDFFVIHGNRKSSEALTAAAAKSKLPISDKFIDSYNEYETKAVQALKEMNLYSIVSSKRGAANV